MEEENGTDVVRRAYPPPEVASAHYGCGGLTVLPTMAGDIWCLGALVSFIRAQLALQGLIRAREDY